MREESTHDATTHELLSQILEVLMDIREALSPGEVSTATPTSPSLPELAPLPQYGAHLTWQQFVEQTNDNVLFDGTGVFATETQRSFVDVTQSDVGMTPPPWATHVVWFNK